MKPYHKILIGFFAFFCIGSSANAQEVSTVKQLYGSKVFHENVFIYTLRYNTKPGGYSFQLEKVTKSNATPVGFSKAFLDKLGADLKTAKIATAADSAKLAEQLEKTQKLFSDVDSKQTEAIAGLEPLSTLINSLADKNAATADAKKKNEAIAVLVNSITAFSTELKGSSPAGAEHPLAELKEAEIIAFIKEDLQKWSLYKSADNASIDQLGKDIFNDLNVRKDYNNDEPPTARLQLTSDMIAIYQFKSKKDSLITEMKVKNIQFEFDGGAIKNILGELSIPGSTSNYGKFLFRNNKPITVSGKYDGDSFDRQRIFSFKLNSQQKQLLKIKPSDNDIIYFRLSELMSYIIMLKNSKEDYSPADCQVDLSPESPLITLKKQLRSKILSIKAYTDFNGLNSEAPNGLVQFEGSIGTNIITKRFQGAMFARPFDWYTGVLTRIDLTGTLSKIEEHNKYLVLNDSYLNADSLAKGVKTFKINALNLFKYQSNSINVNLNIYKLNIPQAKLNLQVNGSIGILRTGITDSVTISKIPPAVTYTTGVGAARNSRTVTSSNYLFTGQLEFTPEDRYGFSVAYRFYYLSPLSPEVIPLAGKDRRINTLMINGFICTSDNSKLFFRWHLNKLASDSRLNYNQVQIGYLIDIFKSNN